MLETLLQHAMIHVGYGELGLDLRYSHRLKLQICHRACGILRESLIDPETYLFAWYHFPGNEMFPDNFLGKIECHLVIPEF
jgi:hypothetical protein